MEIKPTPDSDYLKVEHVFWDIGTGAIEAHICGEDARYGLQELLAEGWRKM